MKALLKALLGFVATTIFVVTIWYLDNSRHIFLVPFLAFAGVAWFFVFVLEYLKLRGREKTRLAKMVRAGFLLSLVCLVVVPHQLHRQHRDQLLTQIEVVDAAEDSWSSSEAQEAFFNWMVGTMQSLHGKIEEHNQGTAIGEHSGLDGEWESWRFKDGTQVFLWDSGRGRKVIIVDHNDDLKDSEKDYVGVDLDDDSRIEGDEKIRDQDGDNDIDEDDVDKWAEKLRSDKEPENDPSDGDVGDAKDAIAQRRKTERERV